MWIPTNCEPKYLLLLTQRRWRRPHTLGYTMPWFLRLELAGPWQDTCILVDFIDGGDIGNEIYEAPQCIDLLRHKEVVLTCNTCNKRAKNAASRS